MIRFPKTPTDGWTHDSLAHDLALWLQACRRRVTWENMEVIMGSRPDVFSLNRSFSSYTAVAWVHEVKVNHSDFLAEMKSQKWIKYLAYCNQLYFACPLGLILPKELPPGVGLWVRHNHWWDIRKGARKMGKGPSKTALYRCALGKYVDPMTLVYE